MLLFMDGMAHYDTARLPAKYSAVDSSYCTWAVTPEGRFGNCLRRVSTANNGPAGVVVVAPFTTRLGTWSPTTSGVCGFAIKIDDLALVGATPTLLRLSSALLRIDEGADWHLGLHLTPDGIFTLIRNGNTTPGGDLVLGHSVEGLTSATWMFVECKWVIHAGAGSFELRMNGTTVLTYTGNNQPIMSTLNKWAISGEIMPAFNFSSHGEAFVYRD